MRLRELVDASAAVAATRARSEKTALLADLLARAGPDEVPIAAAFLSGRLTQRQIGVGWALLRDRPAPAAASTLTLAEVDATFAAVGASSGPGSQAARRDALRDLLARADEEEQGFLVRLLLGDLAQGALGGVMADAVARAAGVPPGEVRRALTLGGDLVEVARIALRDGPTACARFGSPSGGRWRRCSPIRAGRRRRDRAHRPGRRGVEARRRARPGAPRRRRRARLLPHASTTSRPRVPEVVEAARALPARTAVLDGEVDRAAPRRAPGAVPGDRVALRRAPRRRRGCRSPSRSPRSSSTCSTSTARTSSTRAGRGARRRADAPPSRAGWRVPPRVPRVAAEDAAAAFARRGARGGATRA